MPSLLELPVYRKRSANHTDMISRIGTAGVMKV